MDLKDVTNNVHYENYRCKKLGGISNDGKASNKLPNKNPIAQMAEEKNERLEKMKKTEQQMEQVFEMKVKEKMTQLKESESELSKRHDQMKKQLEQQEKELEEKRKMFEKEKEDWGIQHPDHSNTIGAAHSKEKLSLFGTMKKLKN